MVRQMQSEPGDIAGVDFPDTDFAAVAEAFGAEGRRVRTPAGLADALRAGKESSVPTVVDAEIDPDEDMAATLQSSFYASVGGLHE
jgi:acetolactate synthase-1/2/3 large subunit